MEDVGEHAERYAGPIEPDAPPTYAARVLCPADPPCAGCVDKVLDGIAAGQARTLTAEIDRG